MINIIKKAKINNKTDININISIHYDKSANTNVYIKATKQKIIKRTKLALYKNKVSKM